MVALASDRCQRGIGGNGGGGCAIRQPSRISISAKIVRPIDLCTLNASARSPGGCFGISCIPQPHANWTITSAATSQCSAIAKPV